MTKRLLYSIIFILLNITMVLNCSSSVLSATKEQDFNDKVFDNSVIDTLAEDEITINQDKNLDNSIYASSLNPSGYSNKGELYEKQINLHEKSVSELTNESTSIYQNTNFLTSSALGISSIDSNYADDKAYQVFKEGSYFPQLALAKIDFKAMTSSGTNYLTISITEEQDTYLRTLHVLVNDVDKYTTYIGSGTTVLPINIGSYSAGLQKVSVQIEWGAYKLHGWKLNYAYTEPNNQKWAPTQMWFPKSSVSQIETYFIGGYSSWVQLQISADQDSYARYLDILVDDNLIWNNIWLYSSLSATYSLGNYQARSVHKLTLSIEWGGYKEHGWSLNALKPYWLATTVEVDWMQGYEPSVNDLNYIEDYYKTNSYEQVKFIKNEQIPTINNMDGDSLISPIIPIMTEML